MSYASLIPGNPRQNQRVCRPAACGTGCIVRAGTSHVVVADACPSHLHACPFIMQQGAAFHRFRLSVPVLPALVPVIHPSVHVLLSCKGLRSIGSVSHCQSFPPLLSGVHASVIVPSSCNDLCFTGCVSGCLSFPPPCLSLSASPKPKCSTTCLPACLPACLLHLLSILEGAPRLLQRSAALSVPHQLSPQPCRFPRWIF